MSYVLKTLWLKKSCLKIDKQYDLMIANSKLQMYPLPLPDAGIQFDRYP